MTSTVERSCLHFTPVTLSECIRAGNGNLQQYYTRSYVVETPKGSRYRRNGRQLHSTQVWNKVQQKPLPHCLQIQPTSYRIEQGPKKQTTVRLPVARATLEIYIVTHQHPERNHV